jgi:hypothetical protein
MVVVSEVLDRVSAVAVLVGIAVLADAELISSLQTALVVRVVGVVQAAHVVVSL